MHRQAAKAEYADLIPTMAGYRSAGDSLRTIAAKLNQQGHTTRSSGPWERCDSLERLGVCEPATMTDPLPQPIDQ